jgi:N-acetylglucosaminyl-diphospho-decaprenol L-rhamnosyltransferase
MDADRWIADQRRLREAVRAERHAPGDSTPATATPDTDTSDPRSTLAAARNPAERSESSPLVSVIVVCWNSADVIGRCLDQLLAQDYSNYEIVVVDDGSSDDTVKVAERSLESGRLRILSSPRNRGCPHARNLGLREAHGGIVAFIDADGFATAGWMHEIVEAFGSDARIGGVASTVFFARNPLVINGAGGTVNRQGWAADLSMNESYERVEIASEALYPMGCGMAIRRAALERVGPFDDRMLNYYDDVDYGVRLWRAGYRVVVAPDAWVDHDFNTTSEQSARKRLLCERHRMRVALKHTPLRLLGRWAREEALATGRRDRRALKLRAIGWNVRHLPSTLASRWRLRGAAAVPDRLIDPSWGEGFPAGVPSLMRLRPGDARERIDMADPASEGQLSYGWFPAEHVDGRSYRWAGVRAAGIVTLNAPAKRLRLDYTNVPVDTGGVEVWVRRLDAADPRTPVWRAHLSWRYIERSVENHPLALGPGDYEVVFNTAQGWLEPPLETRSLGFALSSLSFDESFEIGTGGLDMASQAVEEQLVCGWFEAEQSPDRSYRWAGGHAEAVLRLAHEVSSARLSYRLPPVPSGGLTVTVNPLDQQVPAWSTHIAWADPDWHEDIFPLRLLAGDYAVSFDVEAAWSNPGQRDPALWAENRSLGFALSAMSFGEVARDRG